MACLRSTYLTFAQYPIPGFLVFVAPTANVDFAMSWGYLFVVLPGALFLNDIFHIVPKGTLGFF